jgi:hypothetical protein
MEHLYEIKVRLNSREWTKVNLGIWRSWGGPRKFNGRRYRGPVYTLGSMNVAEPATTMAWEAE